MVKLLCVLLLLLLLLLLLCTIHSCFASDLRRSGNARACLELEFSCGLCLVYKTGFVWLWDAVTSSLGCVCLSHRYTNTHTQTRICGSHIRNTRSVCVNLAVFQVLTLTHLTFVDVASSSPHLPPLGNTSNQQQIRLLNAVNNILQQTHTHSNTRTHWHSLATHSPTLDHNCIRICI